MGYAEKRGTGDSAYWRGRYKAAPGRYATVSHPDGSVIKFTRKLDAKRAADAEETGQAQAARETATLTAEGRVQFGAYASRWLAGLDVDEDTTASYRSMLTCHLIPAFAGELLDDITRKMVDDWEQAQRERGYRPRSVSNRRNLLAEILTDAVDDPKVTLTVNVAARRRGRGRKAAPPPDLDDDLDEEDEEDSDVHAKVITDPLGALLIAERCAIMSGRDDEFVLVLLGYYTGMRWGELAGLEVRFVQPGKIRIRWALSHDIRRKRPKFGKTRDADLPAWLYELLAAHIERTSPQPCLCHGRTYVFRGLGRVRGTSQAVTLAGVAAAAGVSQATVSAARNRPAAVAATTRERIEAAIAATGYGAAGNQRTPHLYHSSWRAFVWEPAVSGWYPEKSPMPRRLVPVAAEPWPGRPARGRGAAARADACWVPLASGMTPHGLRHAHKSWMLQWRIHEVMSHDRLGHEMPGIAGVYSHPTPAMRAELLDALARVWGESLDTRLALNPRSPVAVLDALLRERAAENSPRILPDDLREASG